MPAPAPDSALLVAARQLADEARDRSRRAGPRARPVPPEGRTGAPGRRQRDDPSD